MKSFLHFLSCASVLFILVSCARVEPPAPVIDYGGGEGAGSAGVHRVEEGDTLYSIAQHYQLAIRDIAHKNGLYPPFNLAVGERLMLPPPQQYSVREGDTIYRVSRLFGVGTSEIAEINKIRSPYRISVGQTLRLPSPTQNQYSETQIAQAAAPKGDFSVNKADPITASPPPRVKIEKSSVRTKITAKTPERSSSQFLRPVNGRILSSYGSKKDGLHNDGINIAAPRGAPVRAAENGVVVYAGNELKGSGNLILIRHEDRFMTAYAHLDKQLIKRGDVVKRGQTIGTVGTSGSVSIPQLHFEVRKGTRAINPTRYLTS